MRRTIICRLLPKFPCAFELRHDDPWWRSHRPPKGWGCKCKVVTHSEREVERLKNEGVVKRTTAPADRYYFWKNPRTGKITRIRRGVDPGWDYSIGEAAWGRTEALRMMEDQGPWIDLDPWGPEKYGRAEQIPVDAAVAALGKPVKPGDVPALRQSLRDVIGSDEVSFIDPAGETIMVTQAIVDHILKKPQSRWDGREAYFPFIPELITDPYEIWISFARSEISGRTGIRRKYVKGIRLDKNRVVGLYAETMNGQWVSENFFRGQFTGAKKPEKRKAVIWKRIKSLQHPC